MMPQIVDIAVGITVDKTFHYTLPEHLSGCLSIGSRVLVPFGARRIIGTVVGFPDRAGASGLKPVIEITDAPLGPDLMELAPWMSGYYLHPLGLTIEAMFPKALASVKPKRMRYLELLSGDHDTDLIRGPKQMELLLLLCERQVVPLEELRPFSPSTIAALRKAGMAGLVEREPRVEPEEAPLSPEAPPVLMPEQAAAVERIGGAVSSGSFGVFLLHGVTGSGKTEVYLRAIALLAGTNKGSIVLVPEIALTPQLLGRFRKRFGGRVAVLHSGLTDRERVDEYRRIRDGSVDVAVGARSAVFAPFQRLGLVIVDEEHENSYKQEEGLRYHARDVAVMRAKFTGAICILGSATPSLESFTNARCDRYGYLPLRHRVDHRPMPVVQIEDQRTRREQTVYSSRLIAAVRERLERREQTLLLLNRRGFSTVLLCEDCGAVLKCPSCSVSLTFHKADKKVKCHYCDFHTAPPDRCPACGGSSLKPLGSGTQKLEDEAAAAFPDAVIARMDSDNVRGKNAYDTLLGRVDRGEIDILLGTQMIAKGHDFPGVTLVGVVNADVGLNIPDFRSSERTFQLVTQAAGRAGRGEKGGAVIIQTMNPGHYALCHSRTHDYEGFYNEEIQFRRELGYPPIRRMIKIELRSVREKIAADAAQQARNRLRNLIKGNEITLLGPAPSPISRVRGKYRFQMLLLSARREAIRSLALEARKTIEEKFGRTVQILIDVDPVNLM